MKAVPIFSHEDADLRKRSWRLSRDGYARTTFNRKPEKPLTLLAHHLVCERAFGRKPDWSKREVCDHINRNRLDNRRENLRITTSSSNARNRKHRNPEHPYAVKHPGGKWQAGLMIKGRYKYIGLFDEPQQATEAARTFIRENNVESAICTHENS